MSQMALSSSDRWSCGIMRELSSDPTAACNLVRSSPDVLGTRNKLDFSWPAEALAQTMPIYQFQSMGMDVYSICLSKMDSVRSLSRSRCFSLHVCTRPSMQGPANHVSCRPKFCAISWLLRATPHLNRPTPSVKGRGMKLQRDSS